MWSRVFCGVSAEHIIECFVFYSMLGWAVESLYMSICNRKLTNRGFGVGPFCPIYGFGAVFGYFLLRPLASHPVLLYLTAAVSATAFEYLVAILMQKVLHQVWWDYNEKPFNYKGLICLESTLRLGHLRSGDRQGDPAGSAAVSGCDARTTEQKSGGFHFILIYAGFYISSAKCIGNRYT